MMKYFTALPDTDHDGLQNAEEEYGWTVKRDINGDGDTNDNIYYGGVLYYKETLLPWGEGGVIWSSWTDNDTDSDGLNDREEKENHTHPQVSDTDHDLLSDWDELKTYGTDPLKSDTDLDGLSDRDELKTYGTDPAVRNDRYAILVAPVRNNDELAFKNDLEDTRTYLVDHGWSDNDIWFLTIEDNDPNTNEWWIDGDATHANMVNALADIANRADTNDLVYIVFVDHGGGYLDHWSAGRAPGNYGGRIDGGAGDPNPNDEFRDGIGEDDNDPNAIGGNEYDECICTLGNDFYDDEFSAMLNNINCRNMIILLASCFSGGFIEDCSNDGTADGRIILTAAPENDFGWYSPGQFTYYLHYFNQALLWTANLGTHNPDTFYTVSNHNGVIDVEEAHAYADEYDTLDTPQIWDWDSMRNFCLWV